MKTLHTAYRVTEVGVSLDFYFALGYQEVGRIRVGDGASLTMLKFPVEEVVTLELVYRAAGGPVEVGTGFNHLVVQVDELAATVDVLSRRRPSRANEGLLDRRDRRAWSALQDRRERLARLA